MTPDTMTELGGTPVLVRVADGPPTRDVADVLDLIGAAWTQGAAWVAIPGDALPDDFFELRSGVAGEFLQKFATYGMRLAVVGDISRHTATSSALRDLVRECERGGQVWFVADITALANRLAALDRPASG